MKNIAKQLNLLLIPSQKNIWKPHILRPNNLFRLAVILLIIKFAVFSWLYYFPQTTNFAIITSTELVEMANKDRVAQGLKPLAINQQLATAAEKKATDMFNKDYFAHTSPTGITPWFWLNNVGYKYTAAGENLAKDFTESVYVHEAWMNSPGHRANILNKNYQDVGIAVVEGVINGQKTILAVEFFGKSTTAKTATPTQTASGKVAVAAIDKTKSNIEIPAPKAETPANVKGEEVTLKGPEVFQQRAISDTINKSESIAGTITEKSEPWSNGIYLAILGIISLVLVLSIFINIKVQYPKMIMTAVVFIIFIAAIMLFNGGELLNRGLEII
jgi:hypothetical protein